MVISEVVGLVIFFIGLSLILLAMLPWRRPRWAEEESRLGGVLIIGPLPIIFGKNISRRFLILLIALSIVLMLIPLLYLWR